MPFREKAKSLFRTKTRGNSLSKTSTNDSERDRQSSNIYKPHEMPRPKYRQPAKKEHKDKLEAFSFSDAWRKKSFQSTYSPMGTRAPSRRNSLFSLGRKSVGSKSTAGKSEGGRADSVASGDSGTRQRDGMGAAVNTDLETEPEQEGDDDVANVGMSRVQSHDKVATSRPKTAEDAQTKGQPNGLHKTVSTAHDHRPFSEQDIALALKRPHLQVPGNP